MAVDLEETGTIGWFIIESRRKELNRELVFPLLDLVEKRLIRLLDVLVLFKDADGNVEALTTDELDPARVGVLGVLAGVSTGLITADDADEAGAVLDPGSEALLFVYENLWSLPFAHAVREAGGIVAASGRVNVQSILARLDALRAG
jgi:hypothetical protein